MQASDAPGPRNRRRIVVLVVVLAILTGAAIVAVFVERYTPLEAGSAFLGPEGSFCTNGSAPGEEGPTCQVAYAHGKITSISFSVRNDGFWGVTVVDFPILHQSVHSLFKVSSATVTDTSDPDAVAVTFKPFALKSGDERLISLYGIFTDCEWYSAGSGNGYDGVVVRYRVAWASHEATIPFPSRVHVISPPDADCPVERSADLKSPTPIATPTFTPSP